MDNVQTIDELLDTRNVLKEKLDSTNTAIDALDSMSIMYGSNSASRQLMAAWLDEASTLQEMLKNMNMQIFILRSKD